MNKTTKTSYIRTAEQYKILTNHLNDIANCEVTKSTVLCLLVS